MSQFHVGSEDRGRGYDVSRNNSKVLTVQHNPRSTTGLLALDEGETASVYHYKKADLSKLRTEAEELVRAARVTRDVTGVHPVKFHHFDTEQQILTTHHVSQADSLFNYLWNGTGLWSRSGRWSVLPEDVGYRLGTWLRAYHESSLARDGTTQAAIESISERSRRKLDRIRQIAPRSLSVNSYEQIDRYLRDAPQDRTLLLHDYTCTVHGDMDPANILVDDTGLLFIVDFADVKTSTPIEDVARLWHGVWIITRVSKRRRSVLLPCLSKILLGYGMPEDDATRSIFRFCRCFNAITGVLVEAMIGRQLSFSSRRLVRRVAQANAEWLSNEQW